MFSKILAPEVQNYIDNHLNESVAKIALAKNPFPEIDFKELINQIVSKKKAQDKLPTWFACNNVIYPKKISIEQTSSEKTAQHKAQLVSGTTLIDLTGGFGVDTYYFAKQFKEVHHCEMNEELSQTVKHNFEQLKVTNCQFHYGDSKTILEQINKQFDCIYIDPSRRNDVKGKVFLLQDCEPNVVTLIDYYFQFTNKILIKTAPLFDITAGLHELKQVEKIHIVAVENEVKEVLWEITKNFEQQIEIIATNIIKKETIHNTFVLDKDYKVSFSLPKKYLFEPNASILKSGKYNALSDILKIDKLHPHSHLYTSNEIVDFPGRSFEIKTILPFQKNEIKKHLTNKKFNCTTRNFPVTVEELRKKYKIQEGGSEFAFFTTNINNEKIILLTQKI